MCKVLAFLADGLEEVECLSVVDVLRRANVDVTLVSVTGKKEVTGSHKITILTDALFEQVDTAEADILFLPGGMPGTLNLKEHKGLAKALESANREGRRISAICAAPSVLGSLGLLKGKTATCYPGYEDQLEGASCSQAGVITDGNITTAKGLGYGLDLGIELVRLLLGSEHALKVKRAIQYDR